jgi:hypothetical protein
MNQTDQLTIFLDGNKLAETTMHMFRYIDRQGVKYGDLLRVPSESRIPAMMQRDQVSCMKFINAATSMFLQSHNVNPSACIMISSSIMMEAGQDNLSLEDLVIFLMRLNSGQHGKFYGEVTPSAFMEKFEEYRQERHEAIISIREEQAAQHKSEGYSGRESDNTSDEKALTMTAVYQHYANNKPSQ